MASPSGPVVVMPARLLTLTCDPAGSPTVTLTEPRGPISDARGPSLGRLTSSRPPANSTVVCSAACTLASSAGSAGTTSTLVSARSLAVTWTWPTMSMSAVMGSGVSKTGMAVPFLWVWPDGLVG